MTFYIKSGNGKLKREPMRQCISRPLVFSRRAIKIESIESS